MQPHSNMAKGLLTWFFLLVALCGCTTSTTAFSTVSAPEKPPQWLKIRKGGNNKGIVSTAARSQSTTTTSLNSSLLGAVDTFYKTMPLASAFVTCGFKASLADFFAQKRAAREEIEGNDDYNVENDSIILDGIEETPFEKRRNFAFLLYGGLYQGMAQQVIYNEIFPVLFGQGQDAETVLSKVLCDSIFVTPFMCLPVAYVVKSVIFQYSLVEAFSRYKDDVLKNGLLVKYWSLWVPVQCLTFGVVPVHLRIAFVAFVSFFWLIIFSSIAAKGQKERDEELCSLEDGVTCHIDG